MVLPVKTGRSVGSSSPSLVVGDGKREREETHKLLTGIYELIVSDCKHNNSLPVSACLLMEAETETDRKNRRGRGEGRGPEEKMRQQNELTKKTQDKGVNK